MLASQGCDSPVLRSSGLYEALERSHHGLYPHSPLIELSDAWRGCSDVQGVYLCLGECRRDQTHPVASLPGDSNHLAGNRIMYEISRPVDN